MVDLWKIGISIFMLAVLIALIEFVSEVSESTSAIVFGIGIIGFALSLAGAIIGSEDKKRTS